MLQYEYCLLDMECNGLLDRVSEIYCIHYRLLDSTFNEVSSGVLTDKIQMSNFLLSQKTIVGHNITLYDVPVFEKILGIKLDNCRLIDTLGLSWYLFPEMKRHGLEEWGEEFGVPKPIIKDWENLDLPTYINRCTEDTKINLLLFQKQMRYLKVIYQEVDFNGIINYLNFKLDCVKEQHEVKCKIDRDLVLNSIEELENLKEEKTNALSEAMPRSIKFKVVNKPAKIFKKDESVSVAGAKWFDLLAEQGLDPEYEGEVYVVESNQPGNPNSTTQLKDWLFQLGWEPETYKTSTNVAGETSDIPQVYDSGEVCSSIRRLYSIEPALENLDMLTLISHRLGVMKSFRDNSDSNDFVIATLGGFTNTLRLKHKKPIANMPKIYLWYGDKIRGSLISPGEGYILCGSDMSALEDTTKQHYMYYFDPEYVTQMRVPGFDPHIDIGKLAKLISSDDEAFFKWFKEKSDDKSIVFEPTDEEKARFSKINSDRNLSKVINFSGIYGAGPPKIAKSTGMSLAQAKTLHSIYWERNKAVKQVSKSVIFKTVEFEGITQMWLYNPVSKFWYSLRYEKDIFSTLNQGTGVYCFDLWVQQVRKKGVRIALQYHDEIMFPLLETQKEHYKEILLKAIEEVNQIVNLNVPLGVSVDFGYRYSDVH